MRFFLLLFLTVNVCAQSTSLIELTNDITEEHFNLPGTKFHIILPNKNFEVVESQSLYSSKDEAKINITDLPMAYEQMLMMFLKDIPSEDEGLIINQDYILNGYQAKLFVQKDVERESVMWIMLMGNQNITFNIIGTYPLNAHNDLKESFVNTFTTFIYKADQVIDEQKGLSYSIDLNNTPLKFASKMMQTGAVYTTDGKFPPEVEDKTNLIIMAMPNFEIEYEELEKFSIEKVNKPYQPAKILETNKLEFEGTIAAYEVIGIKENSPDTYEYFAGIYTNGPYYFIQSVIKKDDLETLEMIKKVVRTFKHKQP